MTIIIMTMMIIITTMAVIVTVMAGNTTAQHQYRRQQFQPYHR